MEVQQPMPGPADVKFYDDHGYREAFSPGGELVVHNTDRLVRRTDEGSPDYRDPVVRPVVWAA